MSFQSLLRTFSLIAALLLVTSVYAQRRKTSSLGLDYGGNLGIAKYFGEIGESSALSSPKEFRQSRWGGGGFVRYQFLTHVAIRLNFQYFRLQGADSLSSDPHRFTRNLSFVNDVFEGSLDMQYVWNLDQASYKSYALDRRVYLYTGIAVFANNPKAKLETSGKYVALRPLNTEGPGKSYGAMQVGIPFGAGFDYIIDRRHRIGLYFRYTITFTDYIDDASSFYPDPEVLDSDEARQFSNRTAEVQSTPQAQTDDGTGTPIHTYFTKGGIRGNPDMMDSYLLFGINYSFFKPKSRRRF